MKKTILLTMIALIIVTISCSKKDDNGEDGFPTFPSTWRWAWPQFGINTLLFIIQGEVNKENFVEIDILYFGDDVPQNSELKINNETIAVPDTSEWGETQWYVDSTHVYQGYYYWIDSDDLPDLANLQAGEAVNYSVKINNETDTGSLKIAYQPDCTFPDFDVEQDYDYTWTIQESPALHYAFFDIEDYNSKYYIYQNWKLSGSARAQTISKSIYQDFIGVEDFFVWIELDAINYERDDDFMALSDKWDEYTEGKKSNNTVDRKSHRDKLLKALLNDIDNL